MNNITGRISRCLKNEEGLALFAAVGIASVLFVLAIGVFAVTQSDLSLSEVAKNNTVALNVAEAGLDKVLWELKNIGSTETTTTVNLSRGTAVVTSEQDEGNPWYWTITSVGTVTTKNSSYRRTVQVVIYNFSFWDMNFAGGSNQSLTAGGGGINGTTSVTGPFYVRGNLEISGSSKFSEGPLFIKNGDIKKISAGSYLGESDQAIDVYVSGEISGNSERIYLDTYSHNVPTINLPESNITTMSESLNNAIIQSKDNLIGYSEALYSFEESSPNRFINANPTYYKLIDSDSNIKLPLGSGTVDLTLNSAVSKFGYSGIDSSDFAWDPNYIGPSGDALLTVRGTVFVDGDVYIGEQNYDIVYDGNGTIVANGDIHIYGQLLSKDEYPSDDVLGLVTPADIYFHTQSSNPLDSDGPRDVQGAFYAGGVVKTMNNILIEGSIVGAELQFDHPNTHLVTNPQLPTYIPKDMPGSTERLTLTALWREL